MNKPKHSVSHFLLHMQYLKEIEYRRTRHMFVLIYLFQIRITLLRFELSFSKIIKGKLEPSVISKYA